ncbi:MAG: hypothetical protein HYV07_20795 [Deltaproteobacteria bacterium]|nr:hypothetical protein [Deltaproteobacteria bacterium]
MRPALSSLLLCGSMACTESTHLSIELREGDFVAGGKLSRAGGIEDAFLALVGPSKSLSRHVDLDGESLVVFRWSSEALVGPDGQGLASEELEAAGLGALSSGCRRCAHPEASDRQLIVPGDLCPPPIFSESVVNGAPASAEVVEATRQSLLILWPGECECDPEPLLLDDTIAPVDVRTLAPMDEPTFYPELAPSSDGSITFFGLGSMLTLSPGGAREERRWTTNGPYASGPDAAVAVRSGHVVAEKVPPSPEARSAGNLRGIDLLLLPRSGGVAHRLQTGLGDVNELIEAPGRDLFLVSGARSARSPLEGDRASLMVCAPRGSELSCAELSPPNFGVEDEMLGARVLTNGALVAISELGRLLLFERLPDPDEVVRHEPRGDGGALLLRDESRIAYRYLDLLPGEEVDGVHHLATFGDRAYACMTLNDSEASTVVLSTGISAALETSDFRTRSCSGRQEFGCTALFSRPDGIRAWIPLVDGFDGTSPGRPIDFDSGGRWASAQSCGAEAPSIPGVEVDEVRWTGNGLYVLDVAGRWYALADDGQSLELVQGSRDVERFTAVAGSSNRAWAFSSTVAAVVGPEGLVERSELGSAFRSTPRAAVHLEVTGELVVAGRRWISRLSPDLEVRSTLVLPGVLVSVASLDGRRALVATEPKSDRDPMLFELLEDSLRPIEIDWDDPSTSKHETRSDFDCKAPVRHISGSQGAGFAVGCEGLVLRLLPSAAGVATRRIPYGGYEQSPGHLRDLEVTRALCADRALLATQAADDPGAMLFDTSGPAWAEGQIPRVIESVDGGHSGLAAISVHEGRVLAIHTEGFIDHRSLTRSVRTLVGDGVEYGAAWIGDFVLMATRHGRLIYGK